MTQSPPMLFLDSIRSAPVARATGAAWLDRLRARALERANALSVPTTRDEDWRFTDLAPLGRLTFQPAAAPAAIGITDLRAFELAEACARLVFVDGQFVDTLSSLPPARAGVHLYDLRAALQACESTVAGHLAEYAKFEAQLFVALNTAFLRDAAVLVLDPEVTLSQPVHVLHVATQRERAYACYPRTLVVAGAGSRATVIEDYVNLGAGTYFTAPVTEITLAANAHIEHVRLQREGMDAFHVATCAVAQSAGSRYVAVSVAMGGRIARLDHHIVQRQPGCETELHGLTLIGRRQLADMHSFVDHAHPQGKLRQMQKCVVGSGGHAVFNGKVLVREGAIQTDAAQSFRALLLSDRARIDAKPQLEIFADDVKCAHGAAIGQLDAEQVFYLRSRGLSDAAARNLLTYAFAAEVIERIPVRSLAAGLASVVLERTQEQR